MTDTTTEQLEALGDMAAERARGRTVVQVGIPAALVTVAAWLARLVGLDLNPLPDAEDLPTEVTAAFIALATAGIARRMNPTSTPAGSGADDAHVRRSRPLFAVRGRREPDDAAGA